MWVRRIPRLVDFQANPKIWLLTLKSALNIKHHKCIIFPTFKINKLFISIYTLNTAVLKKLGLEYANNIFEWNDVNINLERNVWRLRVSKYTERIIFCENTFLF